MLVADLDGLLKEYQTSRRPELRHRFCHAPYISLNFHQSGNVNACCYNRNHVLGRYPENSIQEIWEGEKLRELRQALETPDFSLGCQGCALVLQEKAFISMHARDYDHKMPARGRLEVDAPTHFEFEISNLCNLECVMCDGTFSSLIRKNREKLPPLKIPYDREFVSQLRPFWKNIRTASFLGGEPFLNKLYFLIWEDIAELNPDIEISIITNATVMNDRVRTLLKRLKATVTMSIDSFERRTYESIRKNAKFDVVMKNRGEFVELGRRNGRAAGVSLCPMTLNQREIPEMFLWGVQNGVEVIFNNLWKPANLSLRSLETGELAELAHYYDEFLDRNILPKADPSNPASAATVSRFRELTSQVHGWVKCKHLPQGTLSQNSAS